MLSVFATFLFFALGVITAPTIRPLLGYPSSWSPSSQLRLGGYQFINPLLSCEIAQKSDAKEVKGFKEKLAAVVYDEKTSGRVSDASVYFRDLNGGYWVGIGEDSPYDPASLTKVPLMIAYLKLAESNPSLLSERYMFDSEIDANKDLYIKPPTSLERGTSYSVDELIHRMIVYSGNNSANLLLANVPDRSFREVYTDLGLQLPQPSGDYVSAKTYSLFFRILYNGTYLSRDMSERALKILSEATFKNGIVAGVPEDLAIAHKFGERSIKTPSGEIIPSELHDCGIVYNPGKPYFICVMTKGNNFDAMASTIKNISRVAYEEVSTKP